MGGSLKACLMNDPGPCSPGEMRSWSLLDPIRGKLSDGALGTRAASCGSLLGSEEPSVWPLEAGAQSQGRDELTAGPWPLAQASRFLCRTQGMASVPAAAGRGGARGAARRPGPHSLVLAPSPLCHRASSVTLALPGPVPGAPESPGCGLVRNNLGPQTATYQFPACAGNLPVPGPPGGHGQTEQLPRTVCVGLGVSRSWDPASVLTPRCFPLSPCSPVLTAPQAHQFFCWPPSPLSSPRPDPSLPRSCPPFSPPQPEVSPA